MHVLYLLYSHTNACRSRENVHPMLALFAHSFTVFFFFFYQVCLPLALSRFNNTHTLNRRSKQACIKTHYCKYRFHQGSSAHDYTDMPGRKKSHGRKKKSSEVCNCAHAPDFQSCSVDYFNSLHFPCLITEYAQKHSQS